MAIATNPPQALTYEQMMNLFGETNRMFQETDRKLQETKAILEKISLETDKKIQETKAIIEKSALETEKKLQETDRQMRNLLNKMSESESRWGKFVESLVEGSLLELFQEKGIEVDSLLQRVHGIYNQKEYEFDLIARNHNILVVVEVKTTLKPIHITKLLRDLEEFKEMFPEWQERQIYGCVAYINTIGNAEIMSEKKGLFVIKATGNSARIINTSEFVPRTW